MEKTVTVVMSAFNGEAYIQEAVKSVLNQSFTDFMLWIIDDASTDRTPDIIASFKDKRISVFRNEKNLGLTKSLNNALAECRTRYIARMDCDDICHKDRLKKQIFCLEADLQLGVCGSRYRPLGRRFFARKMPLSPEEMRVFLLFDSPLCHPSVTMRTELIRSLGGYNENFRYAQDFDLFERCAGAGRLANLPEVLLFLREHGGQISTKNRAKQQEFANTVRKRVLEATAWEFSDSELSLHLKAGSFDFIPGPEELLKLSDWLRKLTDMNNQKPVYSAEYFQRIIGLRWLQICAYSSQFLGGKAAFIWKASPLSKFCAWPAITGTLLFLAGVKKKV